jgi:hypothetical protein
MDGKGMRVKNPVNFPSEIGALAHAYVGKNVLWVPARRMKQDSSRIFEAS